jgi:hypothetical protein
MNGFRELAEAGDHAAIEAMLAADVVFSSPVAFKPYIGKALTAAILRGVARAFDDFHYVREMRSVDGRHQALVFQATVAGKEIHGCDFLHYDEDGKVDDLMVMVRPLSATIALGEAMGAEFDQIQREALVG